MLANPNTGLFKQVKRRVVERIVDIKNDLGDSTVDDHFRAHKARGKSRVDRPVSHACAVISSLSNGILFGVGTEAFFEPRTATG